MAAVDTNVLLRHLLQDDPKQSAAFARLLRATADAGATLFVPITVTLELEWVLRSRFRRDKPGILDTFAGLLQTAELRFEAPDALEWALKLFKTTAAEFTDCLHTALAQEAAEEPLWTFDKIAAQLQGAARLS